MLWLGWLCTWRYNDVRAHCRCLPWSHMKTKIKYLLYLYQRFGMPQMGVITSLFKYTIFIHGNTHAPINIHLAKAVSWIHTRKKPAFFNANQWAAAFIPFTLNTTIQQQNAHAQHLQTSNRIPCLEFGLFQLVELCYFITFSYLMDRCSPP